MSVAARIKSSLSSLFSSPSAAIRPHMTRRELACYDRYLDGAASLLEYGAGGSTLHAIQRSTRTILSIETDRGWIEKLRELEPIAQAEQRGTLRMIHVDIGPLEKWGNPADRSKSKNWPQYPLTPWQPALWQDRRPPDLVLVDGRFRVACIAASVVHGADSTLIAVHDFWNRKEYHRALEILEVVDRAGTLGIFRRATDRPPQTIDLLTRQLLEDHAMTPR